MPNWAEGTLKLRGRRENVASALKEMLLGNKGATLEEETVQDVRLFLVKILKFGWMMIL